MKKATIWLLILFFLSSCTRTDTSESRAQGLVEGDVLTLKAMVSGSIEEIHLAEGKRINSSDLLVRINTEKINNQLRELDIARREIRVQTQNLRQKIKMADANIAHLKKQVARFRRLAEKQSIPGENLETMELKLLGAETSRYDILKSLEALRIQVDKLDNKQQYLELLSKDHLIISPVDGVVIERFVSPGENVFPGTPVADILDESSLYVEMFIEEVELAELKLNQSVRLLMDSVDRFLSGTVVYFGRKAEFSPKYIISEKERESLLYQVKVRIDEDRDLFKIGMPVTVIF